MRWVAGARERLLGLFFRAREDAEMDEELRFHLDMEAERLVREEGLDPREARRRAHVAFGGVERVREEVRDARGLAWVAGMRLDFVLGFRMLAKHPGLTLVGGLAIAFAIAVGAASFEVAGQLLHPRLPLPDGDRVVGLHNWDAAASRARRRAAADLLAWRAEARTVEELGAFRTLPRNLITGDGPVEPVQVAEMSATGFRVARVPPLLGRTLVEADEAPGAPPVVVIGHDVWRTRFGGDPGVVGRTLRLGGTRSTVVGVMPEGFAFPVAHSLWVPFRPGDPAHGEGPEVQLFGRLAPGATLAEARAELATLGRRAAADFPATHRHLRPEVLPYAESIFPVRADATARAALYSIVLFFAVFLGLSCGNVATLVFARTAMRESEIVVRTALGASRGRIVMQLFAEALVLAGVAAAVGLAAAAMGLGWGRTLLQSEEVLLPFWLAPRLSWPTVLYVGGLAVLGAAIVGVLPALRVTGPGVEGRLRRTATGGGMRLGGLWTKVIVAQVAVTVALPAAAYFTRRDAVQLRALEPGFAAGEFLSARLDMDRETEAGALDEAAWAARFGRSYEEVERRLAMEPGVAGATHADRLPRMDHPQRRVEVEGAAAPPSGLSLCQGGAVLAGQPECVSGASVAADYFEVMGAPVLSGRGFHAGDLAPGARVVVVNQSFAARTMGGRNPVGRRVRYLDPADPDAAAPDAEPGPWHEIVGVVKDLAMTDGSDPGESGAGVYHPVAPGAAGPVLLAVRLRGDPAAFAPRLRALSAAVDPTLRLDRFLPLDEVQRDSLASIAFWFRILLLAAAVALLLSLAGIYAVMSFAVSRRTREIGIRVALGADARRIVRAIFSRALAQVAIGVAVGGALTAALALLISGGRVSLGGAAWVAGHMAVMVAVCLLACVEPTRRALRVHPTEALRADA